MRNSDRITLKSLSQKLGFSVTTISRVLNGKADKYRISKKTADIIRQAANDLNFTSNTLARGLRLRKTHTLGLVIPDISVDFGTVFYTGWRSFISCVRTGARRSFSENCGNR